MIRVLRTAWCRWVGRHELFLRFEPMRTYCPHCGFESEGFR